MRARVCWLLVLIAVFWGSIKLEQTALFDGASVLYAAGRQTTWHVVR